MLGLAQQPCQLGVFLNTPTQKHGTERLPAKVLRIKNRMLDKAELNALIGDPHAWDMLYAEEPGKPAQPFWAGKLAAFALATKKFKACGIKLKFGLKPFEIEFAEATVKSVQLECNVGGLTAMSFTIVCLKSNIQGDLVKLDDHLDLSADIAVVLGDPEDDDDGDEEQDELDLGHPTEIATASEAEPEEPLTEGQAEIAAPRRGRRPRSVPAGDALN